MNRFTTLHSQQCVLVNQFTVPLILHSDGIKIRFTGTAVEPVHVNTKRQPCAWYVQCLLLQTIFFCLATVPGHTDFHTDFHTDCDSHTCEETRALVHSVFTWTKSRSRNHFLWTRFSCTSVHRSPCVYALTQSHKFLLFYTWAMTDTPCRNDSNLRADIHPFMQPVDAALAETKDYYSVIEKPMCFQKSE